MPEELMTIGAHNQAAMPKSIVDFLWRDNSAFLQQCNVYDADFAKFLAKFAENAAMAVLPVPDYHGSMDRKENSGLTTIDALTRLMYRIVSRVSDMKPFPQFAKALAGLYAANVPACRMFISAAVEAPVQHIQLLAKCTAQEARAAYADLCMTALEAVAAVEAPQYLATEAITLPPPEPTPAAAAAAAEDAESSGAVEESSDAAAAATAGGDGAGDGAAAGPAAPPAPVVVHRPTMPTSLFWDKMLSYEVLDEVSSSWRQFGEYWSLLHRFAKAGYQQVKRRGS